MTEELKEIPANTIPDACAYFYILQCADGSFYCGSTNNIFLRLQQHRAGEGANYTRKLLPVRLVYVETFDKLFVAFQREKQIQGWTRAKKIALIKNDIELLKKLNTENHVIN